MTFRISWDPNENYVSILAPTAQDALLLSADFARKGLPAMVSEMDGTPLTSLDLELMVAAQQASAKPAAQ